MGIGEVWWESQESDVQLSLEENPQTARLEVLVHTAKQKQSVEKMGTGRELIEDKCVGDENNKISSYPSKDGNTTVSKSYSFRTNQRTKQQQPLTPSMIRFLPRGTFASYRMLIVICIDPWLMCEVKNFCFFLSIDNLDFMYSIYI